MYSSRQVSVKDWASEKAATGITYITCLIWHAKMTHKLALFLSRAIDAWIPAAVL